MQLNLLVRLFRFHDESFIVKNIFLCLEKKFKFPPCSRQITKRNIFKLLISFESKINVKEESRNSHCKSKPFTTLKDRASFDVENRDKIRL